MSVPSSVVPPLSGRPPPWSVFTVLAVAILAFAPTLSGGFLGDDFAYIARFDIFPWRDWPSLFAKDWSGGMWGSPLHELRPFAALSFMSDARFFGDFAPGYRLTNLVLHLVSTFVLMRLAWRYSLGSVTAALVCGLAFALHPAHAEAVAWVTGRVDLLATAAALVFWFGAESFSDAGHRRCAVVTLTALFVGIFSKELCFFAPLLLLLRWVLLGWPAPAGVWRRRLTILIGAALLLVVYSLCRRAAFGSDSIGYNIWTDDPAWRRQAAHFGWLVPLLPFTGRQEWLNPFPIATLHGLWLALAALTVAGLAFAIWRRARLAGETLFFGGLWLFVTIFPLAGVVYFSPRHLYFPTVGFALALGLGAAALRARPAQIVFGSVVSIWFAAALFAAAQPWVAAARVSRAALTALDRELATATPGTFVLTSVPETLGPVWLWAWSSPACVGAPFLRHPVPPGQVIERPVNYSRSDHWLDERRPHLALRQVSEAVALWVNAAGEVSCRRVSPAQLQARVASFTTPPSVEEWDAFVKSLAIAPP